MNKLATLTFGLLRLGGILSCCVMARVPLSPDDAPRSGRGQHSNQDVIHTSPRFVVSRTPNLAANGLQ